jgi:predicted metal-dependent enzyme (double-stranded beta helix superfamily)
MITPSDKSTVATPLGVEIEIHQKTAPILSLSELDDRLLEVLRISEDPFRLEKAKALIEQYQGADWREFRRTTNPDGSALAGYDRVRFARHEGLYDLLILSWAPGTQSKIHDHPCDRCFLMSINGDMFEERYDMLNGGIPKLRHRTCIPNGVATWISDDLGLHSVGNEGSEVSVSLHCYVPGLTTAWNLYCPITREYCGTSDCVPPQTK